MYIPSVDSSALSTTWLQPWFLWYEDSVLMVWDGDYMEETHRNKPNRQYLYPVLAIQIHCKSYSINDTIPNLVFWLFVFVFGYIPPRLRRTPLKRGLAVAVRCLCTRITYIAETALEIYMTVQASRRQRPLSKGVPRQWRGMYNAGGASTYHKSPI